MASFTVALDPVEFPSGKAVVRVHVGGGKYATFAVQNGETIVTADAETARCLATLGPREVAPLAEEPAKSTHDVDTKPKEDLPMDKPAASRVT